MRRVILHSDMNNFYASVECLYNPALRGKPVAVGGNPENRHGIILAKNYLAKAKGVQTGEALWEAQQKCPDIVFVPPSYDKYLRFSKLAQKIYSQYTDLVEPFGLDECWLDVSGSTHLFGSGEAIANELRQRIQSELGITVSIGVSYNKIFAKLGSDMQKPNATTVITKEDFKTKVWPLHVSELLYVGRATTAKLHRYGINTIGQLAGQNAAFIQNLLGVNGLMLHRFANGHDYTPVSEQGAAVPIKSVGNSTTTPRDLTCMDDVKIIIYILAESVAARMRENGFICRTVQISVRDNNLNSFERQAPLRESSGLSEDIAGTAISLFKDNVKLPYKIRSIGVRACNLMPAENRQLSFSALTQDKYERLETTVENLRSRFGFNMLQRGLMLTDTSLSNLNPKADHTIHPVAFLR